MKKIGTLLIIIGLAIIVWSLYVFFRYIGLGGDNSYTPYTALIGLIITIVGFRLKRK
jgi:hypothetical protein